MKWVALSCGHSCWVSWLEAFEGREAMCPGPGIEGLSGGNPRCGRSPQRIVSVFGKLEVVA